LVILWRRASESNKNRKIIVYKERYSNLINYFLFNDYYDIRLFGLDAELKDPLKREVFTDELLNLQRNFVGELSDKLKELFTNMGLDKYTLKKIRSQRWDVQAKGFREAAQMNITDAIEDILKYLKQ